MKCVNFVECILQGWSGCQTILYRNELAFSWRRQNSFSQMVRIFLNFDNQQH